MTSPTRMISPRISLDENLPGVRWFTWKEVLWLPRWFIHVYPTQEQYVNLIRVASRLNWIREYFERPVTITSGLRPLNYNELIGGARESCHIVGQALDFVVRDVDADEVRSELLPLLDRLSLRMEDLPGSNWVHIDIKEPIRNRYFKP